MFVVTVTEESSICESGEDAVFSFLTSKSEMGTDDLKRGQESLKVLTADEKRWPTERSERGPLKKKEPDDPSVKVICPVRERMSETTGKAITGVVSQS